MAILNVNTKIDEHKTIGEIQQLLASKGAQTIMVDYEDAVPVALKFQMKINTQLVPFSLPARFEGVRKVMLSDIKNRSIRSKREADTAFTAQARRVSWRILRTWIAAQMALVEAGQAEVAEVFMPYITNGVSTLYERLASEPKLLALTSGS